MREDYAAIVEVVRVGRRCGGLVSRGGVALLAKTVRVSGLERGLRRGLAPWTRGRAVHDPGRVVLQKAYSLAALLAEGATSRVIADTLVVTLDTVTRHDVFGESQGGQPDPGGRALARDLGLLR